MLSLDDKLLLITSRVFSLLEPNDQDDLVITFIINRACARPFAGQDVVHAHAYGRGRKIRHQGLQG